MGRFKKRPFFLLWLVVLLMLPDESRIGQTAEQKIYKVSIDDVTSLAIQNNFDIQLARYDAWIAQTDQEEAQSIYDTILTAKVEYQNNQKAQSSTIPGTKAITNDYNIGLSQKMPMGTTIGMEMSNSRQWTDSIFSSSPLVHESSLKLSITQELGKNFFGIQDRGSVKLTLLDIENSLHTSLDTIEESLAEVQKAYWDLVLHSEKVTIEKNMLDQAKKLLDLHQEKLHDGLVELPEVIASEANYRKRLNEYRLAQNERDAKNNILNLLLNISEEDVILVPTEKLDLPEGTEEFDPSLKLALENREDYKKELNDILSKKVTLTMKKNNIWPEIDLTASLKRNGLGDHFKQAVENITHENNPDFFAGLNISFPLENREARSELKAAELEKMKALLNLKRLEREIATDIKNQVQDCNVFKEVAINRDRIARLQIRKLEEEQKRFSLGRSDTDTIIRFQEDVIHAQWLAAQAKYNYFIAVIDLRRKEGTLLKDYWKEDLSL